MVKHVERKATSQKKSHVISEQNLVPTSVKMVEEGSPLKKHSPQTKEEMAVFKIE